MGNRFMKSLSSAVALSLFVAALGACSKSSDKTADAVDNSQGTNSAAEVFKRGKYDPPITMSTVKEVVSSWKFKEGETIENNVHTRMIKDRLGIDLKFLWTTPNTNSAFNNKLRLSLSANEELPDVVVLKDTQIANQLIDTGKFMAVDELFDKYATKEYKNAINADPSIWYPFIRDGKKFALPILDYTLNQESVLWIRQDWMEKYNLQAPKTVEDLERIMEVFRTKDPDGNGKDDTVPMAAALKNSFSNWMADMSFVFGWYGAIPNQWNPAGGDSLQYGSIDPSAKLALGKIKDWMKKGYISGEAGTMDENKSTELFLNGKSGIVAGPHYMADWPLRDLAKNVPGARFKAYEFPKGPDGKIGIHGLPMKHNGIILINKENKHPESILLYYNWFFDNYANPKSGGEFEYGLAKGYDWDVVDGKPQATGTAKGGVNVWPYTITYTGARIPNLMNDAMEKLAKGQPPTTPYEKVVADTRTKEEIDANVILIDYAKKGYIHDEMFTGATTKTMESKWDLLKQMEIETYNKIVYDKLPLEAFDTFVQQWKTSGGDKITEEVSQWYKSVKGKK